MDRRIRAGVGSLAAVLVAGNAWAAPKCAKPDEVSAIQTAAVQQELMVAALTCNEISRFNAFQIGFNKELRKSDATLEHMFWRLFGHGGGEAQYHAFKTRLANDSSMRSIHDNAGYCGEARQVLDAALVAAKPMLTTFVASVPVTETSPVDSCDLRVAGGISSIHAAIATGAMIVPKPNPLRLAMATPVAPAPMVAPPAAPVTSPAVQAAPASTVPTPPAPAKTADAAPKKESSGWLSNIFK